MPIIGNDSAPGFAYHAYSGTSQPNQEAEDVALPATQRIRILRLGAYIGGWNSNCRVYLCVWNSATGALLAQTTQFTVANTGAPANGHVARYEADLVTPLDMDVAGGSVRVGFTRDRNDAHQVSTGSTVNGHFHGRAPYPGGAFAEIDGGFAENRRIGCWIQDYQPLAGAWIFRGGVWVQADELAVMRSGAWEQADTVAVSRGGTWQDAN